MIKPTDGKIGSREFFGLVLILILIKTTGSTPMYLFKVGENATWMMPIFFLFVIILPFFLLYKILQAHLEKHLVEIIYSLLGKWVGFLLILLIFLYSFSSLVLSSRSTVDIVGTLFYPITPKIMIYLLLIFTSYIIANRGLEAVGRTTWLFYPALNLFLLIAILLAFPILHVDFIFPVLGPGLPTLITNSIKHSATYGELFLLAFLYPFIRSNKDFKIGSFIGILFVTIQFSLILAVFVMAFDYPSIESIAYPFQQLTRIIELNAVLANYDSIFLAVWIVASVIRFAALLYITTLIFAYMIRLEEFEPLLLPFSGLIVMLGIIPENPIVVMNYFNKIVIESGWMIINSFPILLWVVWKWKERSAY